MCDLLLARRQPVCLQQQRRDQDLIALLTSADELLGLGIIVPSRNAELVRWCLAHGLRLVQQSTPMTIGLYSEPAGVYLPSIVS